MEDNKSMVAGAENPVVEEDTTIKSSASTNQERSYTRSEVNKMLNAERNKVRDEVLKEYESQKTEAEKLAKMDLEQKLNYELDNKNKEIETLKSELNSQKLQTQANAYADEKGLPLGYIEDWDYTKETAETIKDKIDKLVKLRGTDLEGYLKDKLKQPSPKAVKFNIFLYILIVSLTTQFLNYFKNIKHLFIFSMWKNSKLKKHPFIYRYFYKSLIFNIS